MSYKEYFKTVNGIPLDWDNPATGGGDASGEELWTRFVNRKYFPKGMPEIIEHSTGNDIPRFILFVLKKDYNRLDWIILLKLLKKKLCDYLNNLFKLTFEYIQN